MKNKYTTSDGKQVTQGTINKKLRDTYKGMLVKYVCEGCGSAQAVDHDHSISQKRCKEIGKTELIWDEDNIVFSCRDCHHEWESYKSGDFILHRNFNKRMAHVQKHDPEGYRKRLMLSYFPKNL